MVEIEVRLVLRRPRLHRDRRPLIEHSQPGSVARGRHQLDREIRTTTFEQRLQQILREIDAARHPARRAERDDVTPIIPRHQTERKRGRIRVLRSVVRPLAVHVDAALLVEERPLIRRIHALGPRRESVGVCRLPKRTRDVRHLQQIPVVERVDHGVHVPEHEPVALMRRPVDDVRGANGVRERIAQTLSAREQKSILPAEALQQLVVLELVVELRDGPRIARPHPVRPCHLDGMLLPLRRPGGMRHEVLVAFAGQRIVRMNRIVPELVEVGVRLVGDALAVAVHVQSREGRREH